MEPELPAWFHKDRERQNSRSRAQERKLAKQTQGRVQAGSGSSWRARQDVKNATHLIQAKYTDKPRFTLTVQEIRTIQRDAALAGREGQLVIDFTKDGLRAIIHFEEI